MAISEHTMSVKYDAAGHHARDQWLCLHRNENLFVDSVWTAEASASVFASAPWSAYPDPECRELRDALAASYGVEMSNVYVGNGSDEVLSSLLAWLRTRYSIMRAERIGYRMYPVLAARHGFALETLCDADLDRASREASRAPVVFVVDSPNAVTGARREPEALANLADDGSGFLIWDNCYGEFAGDAVRACPPNVALVRTFSKYYGLAGLRVGYCIAAPPVIEALYERKDVFNVNGVAQSAALLALRNREVFERARTEMIGARDLLISVLTDLGFAILPPAGNFVCASHQEWPAEAIQDALARRRIAVRRFSGIGIDNSLRITVPDAAGVACLADALRTITCPAVV